METPKTLQSAIKHFSDYGNCRKFMIAVRWLDEVVRCPYCNSEKVTYLANAKLYRCYEDHPKQKFSLKVGTVFEDSPIPLEKWLPAVWLVVNCKNGISSYELAKDLGVTQKSAWFMLHRIRLAVQSKSFVKIGGPGSEVEADETFIGGKARNMHKSKKVRVQMRAGTGGKAVVMGLLDREQGKVRATVIPNTKRGILQDQVRRHVEPGTAVYTDEALGYYGLDYDYQHQIVNCHRMSKLGEKVKARGLDKIWPKRGFS